MIRLIVCYMDGGLGIENNTGINLSVACVDGAVFTVGS